MKIFDENYYYRLNLLGYTLQQKESEYIKANIYIKTHGQIYTISYILTTTHNHFLTCDKGYDEMEIYAAQCFGICSEDINPVRINTTHADLIKNNIPNASILLKLLKENAEIILTPYFAIDINSKTLVLFPDKFEQVSSKILFEKLIGA